MEINLCNHSIGIHTEGEDVVLDQAFHVADKGIKISVELVVKVRKIQTHNKAGIFNNEGPWNTLPKEELLLLEFFLKSRPE